MKFFEQASQIAENKMSQSLPRRWAHVQGVARQARTLRAIAGQDYELLEAAAILHDVGYAPDLATTGFHPLDGARYLASIGAPERLVHLVAHHSYAAREALLRGLSAELSAFDDERGTIRDALWYCDLTTSPAGLQVDPRSRMEEIRSRYGPDHLVTRFITDAADELLGAVERTLERVQEQSQPR